MDFSFLFGGSLSVPSISQSEISAIVGRPIFITAETPQGSYLKSNWTWSDFMWFVYSIGFVISLALSFKKIRQIRSFRRDAQPIRTGKIILYRLKQGKTAFSFFNQIFIGGDFTAGEEERILAHEVVHSQNKHTYDLVYYEVLRSLLWFHPLVYLSQRLSTEVHEFQADRAVTRRFNTTQYIEQLLNSAFDTQQISIATSFFNQLILKKRIMMLRKKPKRRQILNYLLILPLLAGMAVWVACSGDPHKKGTTEQGSTVNPPPPPPPAPKELKETKAGGENAEKSSQSVATGIIFSDCEELTGSAYEKCWSEAVRNFVIKKFYGKKVAQYLNSGKNHIFFQIKYNKQGELMDIKVRAPSEKLMSYTKNLLRKLPGRKPFIKNGKPAVKSFAMPITIRK